MTDAQIAERLTAFMQNNGYQQISVEALLERFSIGSEAQIVRAVPLHAPRLSIQRRAGGTLWLVAHTVRMGRTDAKEDDRPEHRRAA